jgi:FMN-dependent dehydrogenase
VLSSASNRSIEEVAAAGGDALRIFGIYLNEDDKTNPALVHHAVRAKYEAFVLTVDSMGPGVSERYLQFGSPVTRVAGYGNFDPARGGVGTSRWRAAKADAIWIAAFPPFCGLNDVTSCVVAITSAEPETARTPDKDRSGVRPGRRRRKSRIGRYWPASSRAAVRQSDDCCGVLDGAARHAQRAPDLPSAYAVVVQT